MNKKSLIILSIIIFLIIISITGLIIYKNIHNEIEIKNNEQAETFVKEKNELMNNELTIDVKIPIEDNNSQNNNDTKKDDYDIAITEIKKCLKDEQWLRNNIYIQKDETFGFEDENISNQEINFLVFKKSSMPIIAVEATSESARISKISLVTYENENVKAEKIDLVHIYHGANNVDANKYVTCTSNMGNGYYSIELRSVANGDVKLIGEYGYNWSYENGSEICKYYIYDSNNSDNIEKKEVSKEEYDKYKTSLNEEQYSFVKVGTELNGANIDTYIK